MTVLASSASVQFGPDQVPEVNASVRLTATCRVYCHTYPGSAPVVWLIDTPVKVSISVPDPDLVTGQDVETARQLAALVTRYLTELEHLATARRDAEPGPHDTVGRAGGVMAAQIGAGRLELVPPAAPGFSPACTKEEASLCARSSPASRSPRSTAAARATCPYGGRRSTRPPPSSPSPCSCTG